MQTPAHRFHPLLIGAHWLTLVLLIGVYAFIELRGLFPKGSDARELMKTVHFLLGLSVFALVLVRLPLRLALRAPPVTPAPSVWQHRVALAMETALYALLLALPLLGWLTLSAQGKDVAVFGLHLPTLIAPDKALGRRLEDVHEFLGELGYWLIGLHAAAALFHHYVMRDDTLRRMWPLGSGTVQPARPLSSTERIVR